MAQQYPTIEFQDIPLKDARTMGRGPRMDPVTAHRVSAGVVFWRSTDEDLKQPKAVAMR